MSLLDAVREGGKAAAARALTAVERAPGAAETAELLDEAWRRPRGVTIGVTGPPGVGKSTLIGALIRRLREERRTVAALAIDPSSRRSGGALLGDRTRFGLGTGDPGLFVRSLAARRSLGGLAETVWPALALLRAIYDVVIVETVGVGQSETEIAEAADFVVLCAQPGAGDALQFMKAGVTEIPDLVVVTKADLGAQAERAAAELGSALALGSGREAPPVALLSARTGQGVEALVEALRGLEAAEGGAALIERREAQARAWVERAIRESFGIEGWNLLRDSGVSPQSGERPFRTVNQIREHLRGVLTAAIGPQPARR